MRSRWKDVHVSKKYHEICNRTNQVQVVLGHKPDLAEDSCVSCDVSTAMRFRREGCDMGSF